MAITFYNDRIIPDKDEFGKSCFMSKDSINSMKGVIVDVNTVVKEGLGYCKNLGVTYTTNNSSEPSFKILFTINYELPGINSIILSDKKKLTFNIRQNGSKT